MIKLNKKTNQSNVMKLINLEITSLNSLLDSQKAFSKQILVFLKGFIGNVEVDSIFSDDINKLLSEASLFLTKINSNIDFYNDLLAILDNIKFNFSSVEYSTTVSKITKYNDKFKSLTEEIFNNNIEIQKFIHSMSIIDISEYISIDSLDKLEEQSSSKESQLQSNNSKNIKKNQNLVENTLTISEINGIVTLPYKLKDVRKILRQEADKYNSLSDVILDKYTIPLKHYKFSAISRFKEAYKLIINKEHGTKKQALNLAFELFYNYNLHPAIITACSNQNELDVYLSCLEFDELDDFHFFKIIYEALPVVVKKNNKVTEIIA